MTATYAPGTDGKIAFPALVDCHVHFRQPGLEYKGDMNSEGTAAYYGGISVVCDMPNTKPPTNSVALFLEKVKMADEAAAQAVAAGRKPVKVHCFFGATAHEHLGELRALWTRPENARLKERCAGLKLYLDNSTGNLKSSAEVTEAAFALCGELQIPLVAHCEQAEINDAAATANPYTAPAAHSLRRPPESEEASVAYAIGLAAAHNTPLHVAHLSTAGGLHAIRAARRAHPSLRLTCEVTPHHLFLSAEDYPSCGCGGGWLKVNPPVRERAPHVDALWEGLLDGAIDCVGTDHAPHAIAEKEAKDGEPPSGLPGVELVVPLLLTVAAGQWPRVAEGFTPTHGDGGAGRRVAAIPEAVRRRLTYDDIVRVMHANPNRIFNLGLGEEPDRTFDAAAPWQVDHRQLHSKQCWSPYDGWQLVGKALL